jgi:hypothetical protein
MRKVLFQSLPHESLDLLSGIFERINVNEDMAVRVSVEISHGLLHTSINVSTFQEDQTSRVWMSVVMEGDGGVYQRGE